MKDIKVQFAKDGIKIEKVIVGEDHYQVTLITPAKQELKPVEGKWYRCIGIGTVSDFTIGKWYKYSVKKYGHWLFFNDKNSEGGWSTDDTPRFFDLSTPLDFDPETLVGKTLDFSEDRQYTVKQITGKTFITKHKGIECEHSIEILLNTTYKVLDPEPTLTVPDSVEFVDWFSDPSLKYNDLILTSEGDGFVLSSDSEGFEKCKNLKLIPCKLEEVQNGDWVVNEERKNKSFHYRLKTEKGWVSFNGSGEYPIIIDSGLSDSINWLKVVQG